MDTSTIDPNASKIFGADAKAAGMIFADSPMSGGIGGAEAGTLTFMVGCEDGDFDAVKGYLMGMGANVFHCGGHGTGEIAKLCNNMILGVSMIAISEGLSMGEKLGADPKILSEIMSVSTARCWSLDTYNPKPGVLEGVPATRDYEGGFMVKLIRKDLGLAIDAAESCGATTEFGEKCLHYYEHLEKDWANKDFGFVYQYIHKNKKL